jgi:hypothetical protein
MDGVEGEWGDEVKDEGLVWKNLFQVAMPSK